MGVKSRKSRRYRGGFGDIYPYLTLINVSCCAGWHDPAGRKLHPPPASKENIMSKEQKSNREGKKKALLTPKEKKAAKKLKKNKSGIVENEIKF
jgi:hypothetical protein